VADYKSDNAVQISNLVKKFGSIRAVDQLNFVVKRGEVFGFLGPNGAGKTTAINIICGLIRPDEGNVMINGMSISTNYHQVKSLIGLCPQHIVIWEMLSCIEQLVFTAQMYGIRKEQARAKGLQLLADLGLTEKRDQLAKTLSGGMQRRLNIALALVHEPEILVLDEPQAGLDPQSRLLVRDYIRSIAGNTTVLLTTHEMDEAERLSDRVAIMDRGKLLVLDTPDNLKSQIGSREILEIKTAACERKVIDDVLAQIPDRAEKKSFNEGTLSIITNAALDILPEIIQVCNKHGITIEDLKIRKKTLEDVFISLTGRGLRE
jgi:ABC-2 type transport system ATP-binding protein